MFKGHTVEGNMPKAHRPRPPGPTIQPHVHRSSATLPSETPRQENCFVLKLRWLEPREKKAQKQLEHTSKEVPSPHGDRRIPALKLWTEPF